MLKLTADEEASAPDWDKAARILSGWAQEHHVTLPTPFSSLSASSELLLDISSTETDLLVLFSSLTEPFYDLGINIEIEKQSDACKRESD